MAHPNLIHIFQRLPLWWSDHAYQSMNIQVMQPKAPQPVYSICVGTWNTQDRCVSKAKHKKGFHNNPFDHDELDDSAYVARKEAQIRKIEEKIRNNGDDIVFLQEIDFLTTGGNLNRHLQQQFRDMLVRNGFDMVITTIPLPGAPSQQRMATIYNQNKLRLIDIPPNAPRGVLPSVITSTFTQYRGFETSFTIVDGGPSHGKTLVATNLHLKYEVDYRDAIEAYQKEMERKNVLHIMGGDTNNIQNSNLSTALGNWTFATNFSDTDGPAPALTVEHSKGKKKAYDRFFIVPPQEQYVTAQTVSQRSELIEIDETGMVQFKPNTDTHLSQSRIGERWRRGVDILKELETRFINTGNAAVLSEMSEVIKMKGITSWYKAISNPGVKQALAPYLQEPQLSHPAPIPSMPTPTTHIPSPIKQKTQKQIECEKQFNLLLEEIEKKQHKFERNREVLAALAARDLHLALTTASGTYFGSELNQKAYDAFHTTCTNAIKTARETLQHHRGWKDFVAKVALTLVCVLIPAALAIMSKINTGSWNFRLFETDSSKKLDALGENINSMSPMMI